MSKYIIEEKGRFGSTIEYLIVPKGKDPYYFGAWVNYDPETKRANCCKCSGPLSAMLTTCKHAKAVKRYADKLADQ